MANIQDKFLQQLSGENVTTNNKEKIGVIPRGGAKRKLGSSDFYEGKTAKSLKKENSKNKTQRAGKRVAHSKSVYKGKKIGQMKSKIF